MSFESAKNLQYVTAIVFAAVALWSITLITNTKTITLTSEAFILKRPFLFLKKTIALNEILEIKEYPYAIKPRVKGANYNIHDGKETVLFLANGKKIKFNSFEVSHMEYKKLLKILYKIKQPITSKK